MKLSELLVDKRMVERNIHKGLLDRKEHERFLKSLPDVTDQAEVVPSLEEYSDSDDEGDES